MDREGQMGGAAAARCPPWHRPALALALAQALPPTQVRRMVGMPGQSSSGQVWTGLRVSILSLRWGSRAHPLGFPDSGVGSAVGWRVAGGAMGPGGTESGPWETCYGNRLALVWDLGSM